jgi:hypothetical protein
MSTASVIPRLQRDSAQGTRDLLAGEPARQRAASSVGHVHPLSVRRQDISFTDVAPGRVEIAIIVTNGGSSRSRTTPALIQAAPLGAFVPWRPLKVLQVPALEPGESVVLRTEAQRPMPRPLESPGRLPPSRLLTALDLIDDEPPTPGAAPASRPGRPLPASTLDLLTGPGTYWAGNLNVFIGGQSVERHVAKALRIVPGRPNVAMFFVGSQPDAYRFDLQGVGPDWEAAIVDPLRASRLSRSRRDGTVIPLGAWTSFPGHKLLMLALRPPANCREEHVEVHVTQHSTQKTAVVEFSFDPQASGPGCYLVA